MTTWALATTAPNLERRVSEKLLDHGHRCQLFWFKIQRVVRGRVVADLKLAFPRYLFVDVVDRCWSRMTDLGVTSFVARDLHPDVMGDLLRRAPDGVLDYEPDACPFKFGARVAVTGTCSFSGHRAIFQYVTRPGRACVLVDLFGRQVNVDIALDDLVEQQELRKRYRSRRYRDSGREACPA